MERKKNIDINGIIYTVEFPNNGSLIDIDLMKLQLSGNRYADVKKNFPQRGKEIDMLATLVVVVPNLEKDLNVSLFSLKPEQQAELMDAYENQLLPWFESVEKEIREIISSKKTNVEG